MPGGTPSSRRWPRSCVLPGPAAQAAQGCPMPAPRAILAAPSRCAGGLRGGHPHREPTSSDVTGQVAKNMIQAFFRTCRRSTVAPRGPRVVPRSRDPRDRPCGCGHDGVRYRLRLGPRRLRRRAQGRLPGGSPRRARRTRRAWRPRRSCAGKTTQGGRRAAGEIHRPPTRPTLKASTSSRGRLREQELKHNRVPEDRGHSSSERAAGFQHLHAADHGRPPA